MDANEDSVLFKTRFRFTDEFDIYLLREVYGQNPYEDMSRWKTIQVNMLQITGKSVSIRTLRNRVQILVKKYLAKAKNNEGKSGIEIEVTELDDLLQQIADMIRETQNKKNVRTSLPQIKNKNTLEKSSYQLGYDFREEVSTSQTQVDHSNFVVSEVNIANVDLLQTGYENEIIINDLEQEVSKESRKRKPLAQTNIAAPTRKKSCIGVRQNTIQYLIRKNEKNYELQKRELHIKERKLLLEEKKHEVDCYERKKKLEIEERRIEMEEQRMKVLLETFNNQQQLIKIIFSNIKSLNC